MNVPHSSHMGGTWERLIRSVHNALEPLLAKAGSQLDDETLRTFMTEVDALSIQDLSVLITYVVQRHQSR